MTDFIVNGPDSTPVVGTSGDDRLVYTLNSGPGGVILSNLTDNLVGGYDGRVDLPTTVDTQFTGIESFTFRDKVGGDDYITTGNGDDLLFGGAGKDFMSATGGSNGMFGGRGSDRLYGGNAFDKLDGGRGNDRLYGNDGGDSLIGGAGNDRIFGGAGDDFIDTGKGNDLVYAGSGSDFIIATIGDERVYAGRGDDMVEINVAGTKTIDGGKGMDNVFAFFDGPAAKGDLLIFNMNTGEHGVVGDASTQSTITKVESYGLYGDIDAKLIGDGNNNVLTSGQGDDVLKGGEGRDTLWGGAGNDLVKGGKGNDRVDGGMGNDTLWGGIGKDTFVFNGGSDVIKDFKDDKDTIEISSFLVAPGTTVQDVISTAVVMVGGYTVIDFGSGNVLTIDGLTDTSLLSNDMVIV